MHVDGLYMHQCMWVCTVGCSYLSFIRSVSQMTVTRPLAKAAALCKRRPFPALALPALKAFSAASICTGAKARSLVTLTHGQRQHAWRGWWMNQWTEKEQVLLPTTTHQSRMHVGVVGRKSMCVLSAQTHRSSTFDQLQCWHADLSSNQIKFLHRKGIV